MEICIWRIGKIIDIILTEAEEQGVISFGRLFHFLSDSGIGLFYHTEESEISLAVDCQLLFLYVLECKIHGADFCLHGDYVDCGLVYFCM